MFRQESLFDNPYAVAAGDELIAKFMDIAEAERNVSNLFGMAASLFLRAQVQYTGASRDYEGSTNRYDQMMADANIRAEYAGMHETAKQDRVHKLEQLISDEYGGRPIAARLLVPNHRNPEVREPHFFTEGLIVANQPRQDITDGKLQLFIPPKTGILSTPLRAETQSLLIIVAGTEENSLVPQYQFAIK